MSLGLTHLYTGDGKGKTTAAIGLCVRAAGRGKRVFFSQFLKGAPTGELNALARLGITCLRTQDSRKFVFQMDEAELEQCREDSARCFQAAWNAAVSGEYDLVVLDEAVCAISVGMLTEEQVVDLIVKKYPETELVLTGRGASDKLKRIVDYVSQVQMIRHPYEKGILAREGIEY